MKRSRLQISYNQRRAFSNHPVDAKTQSANVLSIGTKVEIAPPYVPQEQPPALVAVLSISANFEIAGSLQNT